MGLLKVVRHRWDETWVIIPQDIADKVKMDPAQPLLRCEGEDRRSGMPQPGHPIMCILLLLSALSIHRGFSTTVIGRINQSDTGRWF